MSIRVLLWLLLTVMEAESASLSQSSESRNSMEMSLSNVFHRVARTRFSTQKSKWDLIHRKLEQFQTKMAYFSGSSEMSETAEVRIGKAMADMKQNQPTDLSSTATDAGPVKTILLWESFQRESPLMAAYWLERGANANSMDSQTGRSVLQTAIAKGWKSLAQLLIEKGADCRRTPLLHQLAGEVNSDWSAVAEMLLIGGASIDGVDGSGLTPLHVASQYNAVWLVKLLIRNGVNVEAANERGQRPIHLAVAHHQVVRLLIESGADWRSTDEVGRTALHEAAIENWPLTARLLIHYGARVRNVDRYGKSALDYARKLHYGKLIHTEMARISLFESEFSQSSDSTDSDYSN